MNLIWRFMWVWLTSRFRKPLDFFSTGIINATVLPTDCDLLFHMNNGRYFSLMDLARIDLMARCHALTTLNKNNIYPVIASEMIRFKKSLPLFTRFQIHTKLAGWDDKFFYMEQYFKVKDDIYAMALIKACFLRKNKGRVTPDEILQVLNVSRAPLPLADYLHGWNQADSDYYDKVIHRSDRPLN